MLLVLLDKKVLKYIFWWSSIYPKRNHVVKVLTHFPWLLALGPWGSVCNPSPWFDSVILVQCNTAGQYYHPQIGTARPGFKVRGSVLCLQGLQGLCGCAARWSLWPCAKLGQYDQSTKGSRIPARVKQCELPRNLKWGSLGLPGALAQTQTSTCQVPEGPREQEPQLGRQRTQHHVFSRQLRQTPHGDRGPGAGGRGGGA